MPVISGSFETGTEGWTASWNEYTIDNYPAYREVSNSGYGPSRTGNYHILADSYIVKEIPAESKNSQMDFECYVRSPSNINLDEPYYNGHVALVALPHNAGTNINATLIKKTTFSFTNDYPLTYRKIGIASPIDASFGRYFIFVDAIGEIFGLVDDWKISWEPNTSTYYKHNGVWKPSDKYVKDNGIWKPSTTKVRHTGIWKDV